MEIKIAIVLLCTLTLAGCPLDADDGQTGAQGEQGLSCWDLNNDGINDPDEDINADGNFTTADCNFQVSVKAEQHPEAKFNFKSFCDAFANLGQYPDGCPSATPTLPTGTLVTILNGLFADNNNDPSEIESNQSALVSIRIDGHYAYWKFNNAFVVDQFDFPSNANDRVCKLTCESDNLCVAAYAHKFGSGASFSCSIFHYSDTLSAGWEGICGVGAIGGNGADAADSCSRSIGDTFRLYALDPGT